jgi:hypothetical protein
VYGIDDLSRFAVERRRTSTSDETWRT